MFLTAADEDEIRRVFAAGHQASDLVPLLRRYASHGELDKMPEAIDFFASLATANKASIRGFLAARVPALVMNHYWPVTLSQDADYHHLVGHFVKHGEWADTIVEAVRERQLGMVVGKLQAEALASKS